jgi:hypothetical protein
MSIETATTNATANLRMAPGGAYSTFNFLDETGTRIGSIFGYRGYGVAIQTGATGTAANSIMFSPAGALGIGTLTPNPAVKLDVVGDANFSGTVTGGNIQAKYQDVAEWVPSESDLAAGTVVVLSQERTNTVTVATSAYDTTVAGVISAQPGLSLGEPGPNKELVATTGRVKVRVDATAGPIRIGDLLVTSGTPGMAMKSEAMQINGRTFHQPGTIIGKALEPLAGGKGEILVLLSMQ